jgi:hypothetical protein
VRRARYLLAALLIAALLPASATAAQTAALQVMFRPNRLGDSTSIAFHIQIHALDSRVPSPLTSVAFHYPSSLGVAISGLGLVTCPASTLESIGPAGCPSASRMGRGSAVAELLIGAEIIEESADVAILRAPEAQGHPGLAFYAQGNTPISLPIIFPGLLLPGAAPSSETIHIEIPLVETLPGSPDLSVTRLSATLGPLGLTYYEHLRGKFVPYHPRGILLPNKCPAHGFPFSASFTFLDASSTTTRASVPCPRTVPNVARRP